MNQHKPDRLLFLEHCDINQTEMFTSPHTKMLLSVGHNHINETGIFTSAPH